MTQRAQCTAERIAATAGLHRKVSHTQGRLEPVSQQLVSKEIQRPLFFVFSVLVAGEIGDLNLDRAILLQFFEAGFQVGLHKVVLAAEAGVQAIIDALEISGDPYIERRTQSGELKIVDDSNRGRALLVCLLQDGCAFLAERKAEGRLFVALKRRSGSAKNGLHGVECACLGSGRGCAALSFQVQGNALDRAGIELHRAQPRAAWRDA